MKKYKDNNPLGIAPDTQKIDANEAAVGISFLVELGVRPWIGKVLSVKDEETFLVVDDYGGKHDVSMYKMRSYGNKTV